jgi:hypothetical protein
MWFAELGSGANAAQQAFGRFVGLVLCVDCILEKAPSIARDRWVVEPAMGRDPDAYAASLAEVDEVDPLADSSGTAT